jgi:signal transduction histidine kinase/ActR/RegA family two-component response regulator
MPSTSAFAPSDTGKNRFQRLQFGVVALGVLVILIFAGSSAYDAWRSYRYAVEGTEREIGNVANALAEQTVWSLETVDLLLLDTARWYRSESLDMPRDGINAALAARAAPVQQVRQVVIMDAQGNQLYRSRAFSLQSHNASDRSYFIAQRDDPNAGLFMSEPLTTRSEGRSAVILSRRIEDDAGRFAGIVIANVDLEDLNRFYRAVDPGPGSHVALVRNDGTLLVRNPPAPNVVGRRFPLLAAAAPPGSDARVVNPIDGRMDFIAAAPVRNAPLRLVVTRDVDVALKPWRYETIRVALRTLIVAALGALLLAVFVRQIKRLASSQRALRDSESQLRQVQKMEAMGTLAGGIAHDFNNVLGAILGYGELAVQHSAENSDLRRYLDHVMHAAERAKLLVERILGFSRSGLGDQVLVNVQSVVNETLELLAASLPAGIRLETRLEADNAGVIGDPTYLHQVTMNLCTNAVQSMERGGVLSVVVARTKVADPSTLSRGSLVAGDYVQLSVQDTGAGIPPAVLERIFDPFFTTKSVGEGTGLGLSLVHGIVADLGGAIEVTSTVGRGTRFDIWLPVAGEAAVADVEHARTLPRGNGETVMIVDDEQPLVELAEEIVARLGYEPVGFISSTDAIKAFNAEPQRFDAVLTDEMMPDLAGTELARKILAVRPSIPMLLMSGRAVAPLVDRAKDAGIKEVLRKPLRARDIAESLARVLGSGA